MWIPHDDKLMKLRLLIAAHTGMGGHRGTKVTEATIKAHFTWLKMEEDVKSFVHSRLHCLLTISGEVIPRLLGHALHASLPNKLLHFDFCYMSNGEDDYTYVLVLKEDFSGYVWLEPTKLANADTVANSLIHWFSAFGVVTDWVSDRGSHFKNELVRILQDSLKSSHHFTVAYCPWSNGTVEVVCRELLRATRAITSEFQMPQQAWTSVIPLVQSTLNNSTLVRLGNRCLLTIFTNLAISSPISAIKERRGETVKVHSLSEVRAKQLLNIQQLQKSLDDMHKDVTQRSTKRRRQAVDSLNRRTSVRPVNFWEGDYVLRGFLKRQRGRKPSLRWN